MMVSSSSNMDLTAILQTLESKKTNLDDRIEAYTTLSSHLKEELSFASLDLTKQADRVLSVLKKDVQSDSNNIRQGALEILGFCLHDAEIVRFLTPANTSQLLTLLCQCVEKTEDKTTATRALWCLGKQKCAEAVVSKELPALLDMCDHAFTKWKGQSTAVEHEALDVVSRFVEQVPADMKTHCPKWARHTVPLIVHPAIKIRERILTLLENTVAWMAVSKELRHSLVPEFKSKVCAELKKLFVKNEVFVMKAWSLMVKLFGEELHHGSFINSILPIAELGFKHASPEIKIEAFKAWRFLIDNFALNPNIVCDPKRIKLIMQVFKINNAKVESVALEKLQIWWHFVKALGSKISQNFDQVVVPLLQFCLGGVKSGSVQATPTTPHMGLKNVLSSPATPRLNLSMGSPGLSRPSFPTVQIQGCDVLARVLACPSKTTDLPRVNIALDGLSHEVISSTSMFLKHASVIVSTSLDLICAQGPHIPESLLTYIWQCLMFHLRSAIESSSKSENREALSCFLVHFQTLIFSRTLSAKTMMKLFQPVCNLPQRALSSTAYSVNSGEVVRGTPALFLCEVLLAPSLLQDLASSENYITLFSTLINCGTSSITGVLEFCQAVLDVISRHASFITNPEALWRLWSILANTLQEHVIKTNEVNQGDSLEYNFDCMYAALLLPIRHKLGTQLSQPVCKSLLKTWGELYRSFARLSALVTTAEANIACEELCHKVLHCLNEDDTKDATIIDFLAQVCQVVIDNVDFSSLGQNSTFSHGASLSPSKWIKRKHKPMENLQSFVKLLVRLLENLAYIAEQGETKQKYVSVTAGATCLVDVLMTLFTHITISSIIAKMMDQLAPSTAWFYSASAKKTCSKLFSAAFMQKLEKLWLDISTCIQSRYTMQYDSDFLQSVSPLLRETMLHPRRQIKNQALILWKATFSHAAPLNYPEDLKPTLMKVKEKTPILLPGWIQTDTAVVEETPFSQYSQMDSLAPDPRLPGLPSPHKILGSFMHKAVSPNVKKSPAKLPAPDIPTVNTAKKKLSVSDLRDEDFVVIKTSPKKKRVLTEHQKEVMKERRTLPVMYNNLDLSQDVSLMSQFNTDTQQDSITVQSQSQNDSVIVINSSQSQNVDNQEKGKDKRPSVSKSSSLESLSEDGTSEVRRGLRRRSVRFSTDDRSDSSLERNEEKSDIKSPPVSARSTRSKKETTTGGKEEKTEQDNKVNRKETKTSEEKVENCPVVGSLKEGDANVEADVNSNVKSLESSCDVAASPSLKQNLMHAMGDQWLNTLCSKSTSSSSVGKTDSSVESKSLSGSDKESKSPKISQDSTSSSSQNSQEDALKHFSPFKSFSQSPPERKSRSPGRKCRSQESSKSPKRNRDGKSGHAGSLDRWLVKSPAKGKSPVLDSQRSPDDSFVPNTQSPKDVETSLLHNVIEDTMSPKKSKGNQPSHSFVEDTQSPSKFSQQQHMFSPDANASIEETPTKAAAAEGETQSSMALASSRNLFSEDGDKETQDLTPSLTSPDVPLGTPVLKIKKLTSEEIIELSHTSPEKAVSKALFKEPMTVPKCGLSVDNDSEIPCSQGFPTKDSQNSDTQLSSGFPGLFDTQKSASQESVESAEGFSGILSAEQREELSHASTSSSSNYSTSIVNTESVASSQESDISKPPQQPQKESIDVEDKFTEDLFQTCPTDMETDDGYDPDALSTLKEGSSQSSSGSNKSGSQSTGSSQGSQESIASEAASEGSYNPDQMSTLAEDSGHSRKRKQDTPKKIGLEDVRRTPRQRKKKKFDGFEVDHPLESKDEKVDSTPVRKTGRTPSAKKINISDEDKADLSKKGKESKITSEKSLVASARKVGRGKQNLKDDDKESEDGTVDGNPARSIEKPLSAKKMNSVSEDKEEDSQKENEIEAGKSAGPSTRKVGRPSTKKTDVKGDNVNIMKGEEAADKDKSDDKEGERPKRRSRRSVVDQGDKETDQPVSQETSLSQDSQETAERDARRKGRKRKLEKVDSDEDELPLSQISSQSETKSALRHHGTRSQDEEEDSKPTEAKSEDVNEPDMPRKKRVRKSLAAEMTDSQEDAVLQESNSEPPIKKPRRVQLQPVETPSQNENSTGFPSNIESGVLHKDPVLDQDTKMHNVKESKASKVDSSCSISDDDISIRTDSKESETSIPEEDNTQYSEVILVGMEMESSKSFSEQTQDESQLTESEEITKEGEQTPSNKPSPAPVRRSTTKQKIEAARKRSISKMSDKSADDSSVEDAGEWKDLSAKTVLLEQKDVASEEASKEGGVDKDNMYSQMDLIDSSQAQSKPSAVPNLDMSFCKDSPRAEQEKIKGTVDEIISSLASPVLSPKFAARKRKRNLPKPKVASPLSVRLRSSRLVLRARAHLGSKIVSKASPLAFGNTKKKVSRNVKSSEKEAENSKDLPVEESMNVETSELNDSANAADVDGSEIESTVKDTSTAATSVEDKMDTDTAKEETNVSDNTNINNPSASVLTPSTDSLEETPRKGLEKIKRRLPYINRGFSDSKVLSLNKMRNKNRMTDRGMSIVRRSILKQKSVPDTSSPSRKSCDSEFQPIRVFQIHSPSASPSAGILKKKRLSGGIPPSSPSPPSKRRVSFAEPIISGESPHRSVGLDFIKPRGSSGKQLFMFPRRPVGSLYSPVQANRVKKVVEPVAIDSQPSQSQTSFKSTQESQLNCTDPVYPDLIGCTESVTKVLPQLTSSVWSRGLGQLVKARNIHTVGDLSKLTEVDIHNLPIRSPKVVTVRRVLSDLEQHLEVRRSRDVKTTESDSDTEKSDAGTFKVPTVSTVPPLDTIDESCETDNKENRESPDEPDSLPSMDEALNELAPKNGEDDLNNSIEAESEETTNIEMESCDQPGSQSQSSDPSQSNSQLVSQSIDLQTTTEDSTSVDAGGRLANTLDTLVKETEFKNLQKMRTGDLFQIHQHLTHLTNIVVTAMKSRCHSPTNSQ